MSKIENQFFYSCTPKHRYGITLSSIKPTKSNRKSTKFPSVDSILESIKPKGFPSRQLSFPVYDTCDPFLLHRNGAPGYRLYAVTPKKDMTKHHTGWIFLIETALKSSDIEKAKSFAKSYWAGEECDENLSFRFKSRPGNWEYLTKEILIHHEFPQKQRIGDSFVRCQPDRLTIYARPESETTTILENLGLEATKLGMEVFFTIPDAMLTKVESFIRDVKPIFIIQPRNLDAISA